VKTKDDRRRMLVILNHASPFEGNLQINYDLRKGNTNYQYDNSPAKNTLNKNINIKDSVSLKRCISSSNKKTNNNTLNSINSNNNNNTNLSLPSPEELNDINYEKEQNESLMKEKQDLEEFYKNILLKLNEDDKRREEEMRLHVINMNTHIKYLEQKKQILEDLNYKLNKEYMDIKYDFDFTDKNISQEIENNINKNKLLLKGINESKRKAKIEKDLDQKEFNKRSKQMASTLRNQIKTNKETSILAQKQLNEIQKIYEDKINLIKNKYDMAEDKYRKLQEKIFQNGFNGGSILKNDFEKIMKEFRERMKQHEKYINEIKQSAEGDYDHFDNIKDTTQDNNRKFFDDLKITEDNLDQFMQDILKAKREYEKLIPYINDIINTSSTCNYNAIENNN
jgi:hypothetical protein